MNQPWPTDPPVLQSLQDDLASLRPDEWIPPDDRTVGGCFVCFARGGSGRGASGDPGWAAAVVISGRRSLAAAEVAGEAGAPYIPGLLAAREGPLLESAVRSLAVVPDVLLVNATGRDHPRWAGLALHLGWAVGLPTVGVTNRPLMATGEEPAPRAGAASRLSIGDEHVGWWLRTRSHVRPVAISSGWRANPDTSLEVIQMLATSVRTPAPIRHARRLARTARSRRGGRR